MVPVINKDGTPLMPCQERRARIRMEKGEAVPFWQKGIFCIKLTKQVDNPKFQDVVLGIDPGSKREGYTVATKNGVVINITTNTPDWVKKKIETRRALRRARRQRKCPYRITRANRSITLGKVSPSTLARWNAKLRIISILVKILPISIINIEDISATTKKSKTWNKTFSPLQIGKNIFQRDIKLRYPFITLIVTKGYKTWLHRKIMRYEKSTDKLNYNWDCHNVDSHSLCELALNQKIRYNKKVYRIHFLNWYRRQLHMQTFAKKGIRRRYGTTISLNGLPRGTIIRNLQNKYCMYAIGGSSYSGVSLHSTVDNHRITQKKIDMSEWQVLYYSKFLTSVIH